MMTKGWKYNPTGCVFDEHTDTVCRIAARSDQDEIGAAIAQVPAMVEICRKLDQYAETQLAVGLAIPYPGLVEQSRAILRAVEGKP